MLFLTRFDKHRLSLLFIKKSPKLRLDFNFSPKIRLVHTIEGLVPIIISDTFGENQLGFSKLLW